MVDDRSAIEDLYAASVAALNAGDLSALKAFYADDAIQLPPSGPALFGWEAIRSSLERELEGIALEAGIEVLEAVVCGEWAFARGTYHTIATPRGAAGPTEASGHWLDILKRQRDGSWRIARSTWGEGRGRGG